jgi:DNA-binding NtrC family response regulator
MSQDLSRLTSSPYLARLLIAENKFARVEPLLDTLTAKRLNIDFEVCTSPLSAIQKLSTFPYQLIISGAHLAELNDFLLLRRTQALETFVPLVVTASASESETARRVLGKGAFDFIPIPVNQEHAIATIRLALWQSKLKNLITRKEKALDKYRQHIADYPQAGESFEPSLGRALAALESTISAVEKTILRIEESIECFSDFATSVEHHTRKSALERLDKFLSPFPRL